MTSTNKKFDAAQKKQLLAFAIDVIRSFHQGVIGKDDPKPYDWGENGFAYFGEFVARFTDEYLNARSKFTLLAAKMLKAKSAHEQTIRGLCGQAGQKYVTLTSANQQEVVKALEIAAKALVDEVLAEAGREYVRIEPNFLIKHAVNDVVAIGRVRSMRTELATANTPLSKHSRIKLAIGESSAPNFGEDSTVLMPSSVWVVDVPATKENVPEEAKWLIDVAISLIRLSFQNWQGHFPTAGAIEPHPVYPTSLSRPHVTMEGDDAFIGGWKVPCWYVITAEAAVALNDPKVQTRAAALFDPSDKSLAQRFAQGLGWMTRGRQVSDRAERLLCFFTALEALLTSKDKRDPVTQTISRHASVIYTQHLKARGAVYDRIRSLYQQRSAVVHEGRRDVLWQDVINLQVAVETIFWIVLNQCDLTMSQERFTQSLADASHGLRWEFAEPIQPSAA